MRFGTTINGLLSIALYDATLESVNQGFAGYAEQTPSGIHMPTSRFTPEHHQCEGDGEGP